MPSYARRVMRDTDVYQQPDKKSRKTGDIKAGRHVRVLDVHRTWLQVEDMANVSVRGYISIKSLTPAKKSSADLLPPQPNIKKETENTPSTQEQKSIDDALSVDSPESRRAKASPPPPFPGNTPEGAPMEPTVKLNNANTYKEKRAAAIWNKHGGLLTALAEKYGIDPIAAAAVIIVESSGQAFDKNGKMLIRFEIHHFYKYWGAYNLEKFNKHYQFNKTRKWTGHTFRTKTTEPFVTFHSDNTKEWAAYEFSRKLMGSAAKMSISMGMTQILGSNFKRVGYKSVEEMFDAFKDKKQGERHQIVAFFKYIENDRTNRGIPALRNQDYTAFAAMYNGPGQPDYYGNLIAEYVRLYQKLFQQN